MDEDLSQTALLQVMDLVAECRGLSEPEARAFIEARADLTPRIRAAVLDVYLDIMAQRPGPPEVPGFAILEFIGSGGTARVYKARSLRLGCEVALKISRWSLEAAPELAALFEKELRALLLLQHQHIAAIRDAGRVEIEGKTYLYIATAWIRGDNLADFAAAALAAPDLPPPATGNAIRDHRNALRTWKGTAVSDLLLVFEQVASALAYAHARGVRHLDLSPRNIMVSRCDQRGTPEAFVIDFGMAMVLGAGGGAGLTPSFAAPEVFHAMRAQHISHPESLSKADLFSMGAIMYFVLTGRRPFAEDEHLELDGRELTDCPSVTLRPDHRVSRPLAFVVDRCLKLDPEARGVGTDPLATLAADLRRVREGDFPEGYRASLRESFQFIFRRQRRLVVGLLASGALAAAVIVLAFLLQQARARSAELANEFISEYRSYLRSGATTMDYSGTDNTARLLDRGLEVERLFDSPEIIAEINLMLGRAALVRSRYDDADRYLGRAVDRATEAFGTEDLTTLAARFDRAQLLLKKGDLAQARAEHESVLTERQRTAEGQPLVDSVEAHLNIAQSLGAVGDAARQQGDIPTAEHRFREARELLDRLDALRPRPRSELIDQTRNARAIALSNLVAVIQEQGASRAGELPELWTQLHHDADVWSERSLQRLIVENNYGHYLVQAGRPAEAEPVLERTLKLLRENLGPEHEQTLRAAGNLAVVKDTLDRADAGEAYEVALALKAAKYPTTHPDYLATLQPYSVWLLGHDRADQAAALLTPVVERLDSAQPEPVEVLIRATLGRVLLARHEQARAVDVLERALGRWERLGPPPPAPHGASVLTTLAQAYVELGCREKAEQAYTRARELAARAFPPGHPLMQRLDQVEASLRSQ